jgi:hypothetical protein
MPGGYNDNKKVKTLPTQPTGHQNEQETVIAVYKNHYLLSG